MQQPQPRRDITGGSRFFGAIYGESGIGKSSCLVLDFPDAFFIGPPGGIDLVAQQFGIELASDHGQLRCFEHVVQMLPQILASGRYSAIVLDDASILAEHTLRNAPERRGRSGQTDMFWPYQYASQWFAALRDWAREICPVPFICNFHPMPAWVDDKTGAYFPGRPKFVGKEAAVSFPPLLDFIFRAEARVTPPVAVAAGLAHPNQQQTLPSGQPATDLPPLGREALQPLAASAPNGVAPKKAPLDWPGTFHVNPFDPHWLAKSRLNLSTWDPVPMNLGEILRVCGYSVPRPRGFEWQEEMVVQAAAALLKGENEDLVLKQWAAPIVKSRVADMPKAALAMRWLRRDVKARVELKKREMSLWRELGL